MLVSCRNGLCLGVVILLVHDNHGHPFVCCKNHPGVVLLELCKGSALCWVEVAVVVVLLLLFLKKSVTLISFMGFSAILSALQPFQIYILNRENGKLTFSNGPQLMEKRFMVNCHASLDSPCKSRISKLSHVGGHSTTFDP